MRPKLLIMCFSRLIDDPRVTKQLDLFTDRYEVYTCGMGPRPEGVVEHFELPWGTRDWVLDRWAMIFRRYSSAYWNLPAVKLAKSLLPVGKFDAVLANDLPTVPVALSLGARNGVHADLHEYFPDLKNHDWKWRLFVSPYMKWLCRTFVPKTRSRTAGSSGFARQYEKDLGIPFEVVTNAAPYEDREPRPVGDTIRIICTTAGARARRLEVLVDAMRDAPPGVTLDLIMMPNEAEYVESVKRRGADIPGISFPDPVPYDKLVETVAQYDVALAFIPPTNTSKALALPNKFFEAIQARVGVIIGPGPEMTPLIEEYGVGISTTDYSADALADVIHNLDAETVEQWKQASHRAAPLVSDEKQVAVWERAISRLLD